jgi:quercetin dioxygenase-like cupin family protein
MNIHALVKAFRAEMVAAGFDEVVERQWAPHATAGTHTHPFEALGLVVQGEMWLGVGTEPALQLLPGDRFHLLRDQPHTERYGDDGAIYWVAHRG